MTSPHPNITRAIVPLRLIFWGGLICVFDFKLNEFDLFPDIIGMILVVWGVASLAGLKVDDAYRKAMMFVRITAFLATAKTLLDSFDHDVPPFGAFLFSVISIASMIAVVVFCVSMRRLSEFANLPISRQSWKLTTLLFVIIYLIPLGLFYAVAGVCIVTGQTFNFNFGTAAALLLIPIFLAPLIHLFMSTSRMKREAQMSSGIESDGTRFSA